MDKRVAVFGSMFLILSVLDLVSTSMFLNAGMLEGNPFWSHFNTSGIGVTDVLIKMGGAFFIVFMFYKMLGYEKGFEGKTGMILKVLNFFTIVGINVIMFFVVVLNFMVCL